MSRISDRPKREVKKAKSENKFIHRDDPDKKQPCTLYLSPMMIKALGLMASIEKKKKSDIAEIALKRYIPKQIRDIAKSEDIENTNI